MIKTELSENDLIQKHTGLIVVQASMFNHTSLSDFDDYMSAGRLGLLKAIRTFDADRGKFSTYATVCIRREMIRESQRDKDKWVLRDYSIIAMKEDSAELWEILPDTLTDVEKQVLKHRVEEAFTLEEIGNEFGHSKQWASNVLKKALGKIKEKYEEKT